MIVPNEGRQQSLKILLVDKVSTHPSCCASAVFGGTFSGRGGAKYQQLGEVVIGLCRNVRLLGWECVTTDTGKLKMKGDVGVEEDLGPRVAEGLAASTEQEVAST